MTVRTSFGAASAVLLALCLLPTQALAHCDTLDGPVVKDARRALASRDLSIALKWVQPERDDEVREAFRHSLGVRALGPEAQVLADRFFFETLVRIHREGEGASYTGLKAAGVQIEPVILASDNALETGSVEPLVSMVLAGAERGIRERFADAVEARKRAGESIERGREYVAAYVRFIHYAERLHSDALSEARHAAHAATPALEAHRH
jgi:hypothetical protein